MKRRFFSIILCCSVLFSAIGSTAYAHTGLSNVEHSPSETHWDIFEKGYMIDEETSFPYHSSGNGIMIKINPSLQNNSLFPNIEDTVTHAVNAWTNSSFNGSKIFSGKISKVSYDTQLTTSDINSQKTLVEVYYEYDKGDYWGKAILSSPTNTYYSSTNSGTHVATCKIRLNANTLGQITSSYKPTYMKYTLTHELGHIIGLADLSKSFDDGTFSNYLMGYNNYTMLYPTDADIKGAAVISGYHTTHSNYKYSYYDNSSHKRSCGLCDGYNLVGHDVNRGKCTTCNHIVARTTDTWKVVDGPLNVRDTASTAAYSYGVITNGSTFKISDVKQSGSFILAKISSVSSLASGSTCTAANAVGHWVAIEYCSVV